MANLQYGTITRNTNPRADAGGYKNVVLFAPRSTFLSISKPPDVAAETGDLVTVAGAHTFTDPAGFFSWDCKTHSVTVTGATVGDDGAKEEEWKAAFVLLGDSASTQEQVTRMLNDDMIFLLKEAACLEDDSYIQLGDECVAPTVDVAFDGKTTKEGKKEYTVTVTCKVKYFYAFAVTMSTE